MIKHCPNCGPHAYQDQKYGQNMRVVNFAFKAEVWRCTVCGKDVGGFSKEKKKK